MSSKALMGIAAIAATVAMAAGVLAGTASAGRLSSSSQTFRTVFQRVHVSGVFGNITCIVTLEGSLHSRTITKTANSLVGYITAANLGACAEGSATILRETLPWHTVYVGFGGTLPNITDFFLGIIKFSMRIREPLATCLLIARLGNLLLGMPRSTATGALTGALLVGREIPSTCAVDGEIETDVGTATVLGAATRITITLI